MDSDAEESETQLTQRALDPRRIGQQNSGFSDDDLSDIICFLVPTSDHARLQLQQIILKSSLHIVGRKDLEQVNLDYERDDDARNFTLPVALGEHAIVLRLSAEVKNPLAGFTFGRNRTRCDICFHDDPHRRLSNVHFRIYLNEFGVLMLEDSSTNGTVVDEKLLKSKSNNANNVRRTLTSGSTIKILMHKDTSDLSFMVRIPRREGEHEMAYRRNLVEYMDRLKPLANDAAGVTIAPGPEGRVDLFPEKNQQADPVSNPGTLAHVPTQDNVGRYLGVPRTWNGSDKYHRVGEIGRGAFATVYKVTSRFDGLPYAAKELDKRKFMKDGILDQKVESELIIMQRVMHPNIVRYIEHIDWDNRLFIIIMEYVPGGDLARLVSEFGHLSEETTQVMSRQLLDAVSYLHENNITHRDVKPDNILISSRMPFVVKLADFGLSKMVDNDETFLRTFCGTLLYCAPEVYSEYAEYNDDGRRNPRNRQRRQAVGQRYDHAVDIWSLGGVLFYALTGKPPFPVKVGVSHQELLQLIMTMPLDISPLEWVGISEHGIDFLSRMLNRRPESRARVQELQQHVWLGSPNPSQGFERLSLEDKKNSCAMPRAEDLLVDDVIAESDEGVVDDILDDDTFRGRIGLNVDAYEEKENVAIGPRHGEPRLFGEVGNSAIGSSGAVPSGIFNVPISETRHDSEAGSTSTSSAVRDSFDSDVSALPQGKSRKFPSGAGGLGSVIPDAWQTRSTRSLGDSDGTNLQAANVKCRLGARLPDQYTNDVNTSKRKPSYGSSDDFDTPSLHKRTNYKRVRSEGLEDSVAGEISDNELAEIDLYAQLPSIKINSGRQIDHPVHKAAFWSADDRSSWHLDYPEMTQLQLDAFEAAADARGEKFGPRSPLWRLALKYFPAVHYRQAMNRKNNILSGRRAIGAEGAHNTEHMLDTQYPQDGGNVIVPLQMDPGKRIAATLESSSDSTVPGISIFVTESMVSWGRNLDNTRVFQDRDETRVPKQAFQILLWKEGYDPWRNIRPWGHGGTQDEKSFHFYISTKARNGIHINDVPLPSFEPSIPWSSPRFWMRLYDGDVVDVWKSSAEDTSRRTRLVFRCNWGGSAAPRCRSAMFRNGEIVQDEKVVKKLDEASARLDKKMPDLLEHDRRMEEATLDAMQRKLTVETERERSRDFEARRLEISRSLASHGVAAVRRHSNRLPLSAASHRLGMAPPAAHGQDDMTLRASYVV